MPMKIYENCENIFKTYLVYFHIYLKHIQNMPLFHNKLNNTLLLQMFPNIQIMTSPNPCHNYHI